MRKTKLALIIFSMCGMFTFQAHAEKADKLKKTLVSGESGGFDAGKNVLTLFKVELTRGTLSIRAEKGTDIEFDIDKEHPEGGGSTVLIGSANNPVFFRQKRDGGADMWIEGTALRVEYDKNTEIVNFFGKAKITFLDHGQVTKVLEGEFFSYDSPNDFLTLANSTTGKRVPDGGRVTLIMEPKKAKPETKQEQK